MGIQEKGRHIRVSGAMIFGAMLMSSTVSFAEEMDHSKHGEMDHSQHAGMEHAAAAQASEHVHHAHGAGQWMFEYRFMRMDMDGLIDGTDSVDSMDISGANMVMPSGTPPMKKANKDYMMAPTEMTMDMHMLMVMYGLDDKISLMGMVHYLKNDMDMVMHMYTPVTVPTPPPPPDTYAGDMEGSMDTSGLGDTQIGAMYKVDKNLTASLMLSVPTGDIDQKVDMAMTGTNILNGMPMTSSRTDMQAPYAMQLGTGTYDLIPSISYIASANQWTYGGQAEYRYHIGENDNEYTWGNKLKLGGYGKYAVNKTVSVAGRLDYLKEDSIDGEDPDIAAMMAPTSDPDNYGGTRIDATIDVTGMFNGHTLGLAYTKPLKQDANGPQMELQSIITLSWMYMM